MKPFDKSKFYLGNLCKRGHDYEGSGQSLRYLSNNNCRACEALHHKRSPERLELNRAYKSRNKEKIKFKDALYRKLNKAKYLKLDKTNRMGLSDNYIKRLIMSSEDLKYKFITSEMIELKREQLTIYRGLKQLKKEISDGANPE